MSGYSCLNARDILFPGIYVYRILHVQSQSTEFVSVVLLCSMNVLLNHVDFDWRFYILCMFHSFWMKCGTCLLNHVDGWNRVDKMDKAFILMATGCFGAKNGHE